MLRRVELKNKGKKAFYRNYKSCIAICFIYAVLVGGTLISINKEFDTSVNTNIEFVDIHHKTGEKENSDIVNEFVQGISGNKKSEYDFLGHATQGVLGTIANNVSKTGSFLFGFLNAVNQMLFKDRIWPSVVIIVGAVLSLFYWIFVSKVLEVGQARFYLENRRFVKTRANKLAFPFRLRKVTHIAYTMFLKNLYTILYSFTIIGGFVKSYSYMLVPYILAENPNMNSKDILKLSRDMMNGYKWEMFKLDMSYIGWFFLGIITANISNLVFTTPYIQATRAEVYMYLRDLGRTRGIKNIKKLNDTNLDGEIVFGEYPIYDYMLRSTKERKWLNLNWKRDYAITDLTIIFFIVAFMGWMWEVLLGLFQNGVFINKGTLMGPWLPIYGSGALAMLVLLKNVRRNPLVYFVASMALCGIIEYATSVYLEIVHHMAWWDYTGFFLNINGRICLEALLVFGMGGLVICYIVAPLIAGFLDKVDKKVKIIICIVLVSLISLDFYFSGKKPNMGEGITTEITDSKIMDKWK